jgi:hypothetical protein
MDDKENDETSTSSDEDASKDCFIIEQDQELENMKVNEIDNTLNCCSDDEYGLDQLKYIQNAIFLLFFFRSHPTRFIFICMNRREWENEST